MSRPTKPRKLTEHETDIVRLVARGLSNAQIAEVFDIRPETVRTRLHTINRLTGVSSSDPDPLVRVRLAIWAFDNGFATPKRPARASEPGAVPTPETIRLALDIMADRPRGDLRRWARKILDTAGVRAPQGFRRGRPVTVPAGADDEQEALSNAA